MKLIVGLGNPGEKYENTRHNLGFMVADALLKHFEPVEKTYWEQNRKRKAVTKELSFEGETCILAKPQTFMNDSGQAVSYLVNYYKIDPADVIVVYDDIDLPMGRIRVRFGGAAGGHKGVESIIASLSTDKFLRVRLGIGRPMHIDGKSKKSTIAVEDYVLGKLGGGERRKAKEMVRQTIATITLLLKHGIEKYMSKYHGE